MSKLSVCVSVLCVCVWTCSIILYIEGHNIAFSVLCILKGNTPSVTTVTRYRYPYLTNEGVEMGGN